MHLLDKGENLKIEGGTIDEIINFIKEKVSTIAPELFEKIKALPNEAMNPLKRTLNGSGYEENQIEPLVNYLSRDNSFITNNHKLAIENALQN